MVGIQCGCSGRNRVLRQPDSEANAQPKIQSCSRLRALKVPKGRFVVLHARGDRIQCLEAKVTGYTKLFGSIVGSTIWSEDNETRIVWITMLAMADQHGEVQASIPGLAKFASVSLAAMEAALGKLMAPDPYSRTKDNEGRRIEEIDGGWRLLNHAKYRAVHNADDRREYQRRLMAERRTKDDAKNVSNVLANVSNVSNGEQLLAQAEAEAEAKESPNGVVGGKTPAWEPNPLQLRFNALFHRKATTRWSKSEIKALNANLPLENEELELLERYYSAALPEKADYRRRDLSTLLNNLPGEIDRARNFKEPNCL